MDRRCRACHLTGNRREEEPPEQLREKEAHLAKKNVRTSTYEIILPLIGTDDRETDGKALLLNGLYGALDVADRETADILREGDLSALPQVLPDILKAAGIFLPAMNDSLA